MRWPGIVGLIFLCTSLFGNVCFASLTKNENPQKEPVPMSQKNAASCPWMPVHTENQAPTQKSPCESGHCLVKPLPPRTCFSAVSTEHSPSALPIVKAEFALELAENNSPPPDVTESPPSLVAVATIVLRL